MTFGTKSFSTESKFLQLKLTGNLKSNIGTQGNLFIRANEMFRLEHLEENIVGNYFPYMLSKMKILK